VTYEALATISSNGSDRVSQGLTALPKVVVSSTLSEPLEWENTRLVAGDAIEALPAVKGDSDVPMRTMGSVSLVRNLVGAGRERIFGEGKLEHFELEQTRVLDARVVLLEYRTTS
jgi:hypothetical protein